MEPGRIRLKAARIQPDRMQGISRLTVLLLTIPLETVHPAGILLLTIPRKTAGIIPEMDTGADISRRALGLVY